LHGALDLIPGIKILNSFQAAFQEISGSSCFFLKINQSQAPIFAYLEIAIFLWAIALENRHQSYVPLLSFYPSKPITE